MAARFEFRPNERINEIELSRKLSVSRTPLREVLNQLMVEGFVTRTQNKGFIGRSLDPKEILDLFELRQGIECEIAVLACKRAMANQIDELGAFAEASFCVPEGEDPDRLCALDEEFHMRMAQMTGNHAYENVLSNINARIHYVRWIDMQRGRRGVTQMEHIAIVNALRNQDPVLISSLLEKHIGRRLDQIVEVVKAGFAEIYTRNSIVSPTLASLEAG